MAILTLTDADLFAGTKELSCQSNNVSIESAVEELDATTFCSAGWQEKAAGLRSWQASVSGFSDFASYDAALFASLGAQSVLSVAPQGDNTTPVYFGYATNLTYSDAGEVGQLASFDLSASGADGAGLVRGTYLAPKAEYTGSNTVAPYDHGASIASTAKVYAFAHVLSPSAGTGDTIKVYSSSSVGFGTKTERFSFDAETGASTTMQSVTGTTHRYWRVEHSLTNPATFLVVFAIVG